jgi:hypothetical protein
LVVVDQIKYSARNIVYLLLQIFFRAEISALRCYRTPLTFFFLNLISYIGNLLSEIPCPVSAYPIPHTSYLIPHTSYPIPHTSYLIPHTPYLIPHTSYPIYIRAGYHAITGSFIYVSLVIILSRRCIPLR